MATKNDAANLMDATIEDYYHDLDQWLRRFPYMTLARWKVVQQTAVSVLVFLLAFQNGADPTVAIGVLALINGISVVDVISVWGGGGRGPPADRKDKKQQQNDELPEKETEAKKR